MHLHESHTCFVSNVNMSIYKSYKENHVILAMIAVARVLANEEQFGEGLEENNNSRVLTIYHAKQM